MHTFIDDLEPRQLFASLTPGVTYATSLTSASKEKNWTINLVAGRNVTLAAGDLSGGALQTELSLIGPNNTVLKTSTGSVGSFINTTAPTTGTYRVRLRDVGSNDFGNVNITAFYYASSITDSDDAFAAASGRRFAATIGPGDLDVWTLTAAKGQFLSVGATENSAGSALDVGVLVIGPDGKIVKSAENTKGVKLDIPSAAAGNYYAVVYEPGANTTGRYGITFGRVPGAQYTGDPDTQTPLTNGVTRTGDMPGGDYDIFGINLTAGQTFTATLTRGSTGSLDPELLLIDPTGKLVKTTFGTTGTTLTFKINTTGQWWLFARDHEGDDGGKYTIKYTAV
jgi:hypothetical protein